MLIRETLLSAIRSLLANRLRTALTALAPLALIPLLSACITLKPEHEALEKEVWELRKKVEARDQELSTTLKEAAEQMARVEEQLKKAEELLHLNQASLGVRVGRAHLGEVGMVVDISEDRQRHRGRTGSDQGRRGDRCGVRA